MVAKADEAKPALAQTNQVKNPSAVLVQTKVAKNPSAVGGKSAARTVSGDLRPPLANARPEADAVNRARQ